MDRTEAGQWVVWAEDAYSVSWRFFKSKVTRSSPRTAVVEYFGKQKRINNDAIYGMFAKEDDADRYLEQAKGIATRHIDGIKQAYSVSLKACAAHRQFWPDRRPGGPRP